MPLCVACRIDHPRESFSKAQLRKPPDNKRCQNCIEFHNTVLQLPTKQPPQQLHHQNPFAASSFNKTRRSGVIAATARNRIRPNFRKDPAAMEQATAAAYYAVANESALIAAREEMNDDNNENDDDDDDEQHDSSSFQPTSPTSIFENRFNVNHPKWDWPSRSKKQDNDNDDDNNFVEIIYDDDDDATEKQQKAAPTNNPSSSSNDDHDLHHLDKECAVCMEEFHWDFPSLQQNGKNNEKEQQQHPHTPKILPCSHICCLTCVSRIIGAARKINNERRISELNDRVLSMRNSGMIMRRSQMELSAMNDGNNSNRQNNSSFLIMDIELDKKPACPICRREFFVAADVPRGVREKMKTIILPDYNKNDDLNDKNLKNKSLNSVLLQNQQGTTMTFNNLQETLHIASIGNDVPGIIINLNSDRRCGSIALCETGKCVLFFAPKDSSSSTSSTSSSSSDFSLLQLGMRIVCNVSQLQGTNNNDNANLSKNTQKSKNLKVLLRGELVATSVRTLQDYAVQLFEEKEQEKRRRRLERISRNADAAAVDDDDDDEIIDDNADNFGERRMERESTREVSMFDLEDDDVTEVAAASNNIDSNRRNDYYYDRSGRRVYGHDDDDFEEEEEDGYVDENDDYNDYLENLEEQHDTRYARF